MKRILVILDGKEYEITNVTSFVLHGATETLDYDYVIGIETESETGASGETPLEEAEGIRKPSVAGISSETNSEYSLYDTVEKSIVDSQRLASGVRSIVFAQGHRVRVEIIKTKSVKLTSKEPILECVKEMVAAERLLLTKEQEHLLFLGTPMIRMRKSSVYIIERVEVYDLSEVHDATTEFTV